MLSKKLKLAYYTMGHSITAIITAESIDETKAHQYSLPFVYEKGFCILFLEALHTDFWRAKIKEEQHIDLQDERSAATPILLDCKFTHFIAQELGIQKFALIETDYFGGIGTQWACVYENEVQIMPFLEGGINQALREIGVVAEANLDEFDTIRLVDYRDYDNILLQFFPEKYDEWQSYWD